MNLRQLEVFQAVMQTGNMSAAARLVCITPSAVSKTIAHTELQLGYKLFTRAKGALAPTPEAMVLFDESTAIHGKLEDLRKIAHNLRQVAQGRVRMAALPSVSDELLPAVLQQHAQRYPGVHVEVRTLHQDQMAQALLTRAVDFALGFYPHPHPQLTGSQLANGALYAAMPRDTWQRAMRANRRDPMGFLAGTPLIRLVGDDPMREFINELARVLRVTVEPTIEVQTSRLALELVRRGMGWTVVDFLTAANLDPQYMVALELRDLPPIPLYAYHATASPPGQHALRMLELLRIQPGLAPARAEPEAETLAA
ncbi:LysR family transcriptional regulator [Ramlibacter sp.]|uniref:LysR family transcriptional regulator n=1 Tax=Ramlibacter sp. TaxID=1917967 RepID=UPI00180C0EA9|nr:LysR family transcriptional regulator [Ramlibacter sp.]MBA2673164.1 LysR family transcriptional regulator [Ramlibacter sp.]